MSSITVSASEFRANVELYTSLEVDVIVTDDAPVAPEKPAIGFASTARTVTVEADAPALAGNTLSNAEMNKLMRKLGEWQGTTRNPIETRKHMPIGTRGLRQRKGSITLTEVRAAKSLRLKLNVAFACDVQAEITPEERKSLYKWASAAGLSVAQGKDKPWVITLRTKKDGNPDGRAGDFFKAGGTLIVGRDNVATFSGGNTQAIAQMRQAAAEVLA